MTVMTKTHSATFWDECHPVAVEINGPGQRSDLALTHIATPQNNNDNRLGVEILNGFSVNSGTLRVLFAGIGRINGTLVLLGDTEDHLHDWIERLALSLAGDSDMKPVFCWDTSHATPSFAFLVISVVAAQHCTADVVFGSGMQLQGYRIERTLARRTVSRIFSSQINEAVWQRMRDTLSRGKPMNDSSGFSLTETHKFTAAWPLSTGLSTRLPTRTEDDRCSAFAPPPSNRPTTPVAGLMHR